MPRHTICAIQLRSAVRHREGLIAELAHLCSGLPEYGASFFPLAARSRGNFQGRIAGLTARAGHAAMHRFTVVQANDAHPQTDGHRRYTQHLLYSTLSPGLEISAQNFLERLLRNQAAAQPPDFATNG